MMADGVQLNFTNLDTIINRMSRLESKVQRSIARRATAKGARVIRDQVKANAARLDDPATKTNISRNVVVQHASRLGRQNRGVAYRVGIRGGARTRQENQSNPGGDTFYWRFLEFGTAKMAAKPFIRPAFAQKGNVALDTAIKEALRLLDVEARKEAQR